MNRQLPAGFELSERKRRILRNAIQCYVSEVRPVSSQQLAAAENISSATVRQELHALEEQGYLRQLHTSGGRVPTDRAYRFFVEELVLHLTDGLTRQARVEQVYSQLGQETEALLEATLDILTSMTGYVAWVSLPQQNALTIKSLNFVEVDNQALLLMLVTGGGQMQSKLVSTGLPVKDLKLGALAEQLNSYLRGRNVMDVDFAELRRIFSASLNLPEGLLSSLADFFSGLGDVQEKIVFGNALRLVLQPEFASGDNLSGVLGAIQDKDNFMRRLRSQLDESMLQTIIGSENLDSNLHECSLVLTRYQIPGAGDGTLGVLGPTRQDYLRTLQWVKAVGENVARALGGFSGGGADL